jgi:hypothetical protein
LTVDKTPDQSALTAARLLAMPFDTEALAVESEARRGRAGFFVTAPVSVANEDSSVRAVRFGKLPASVAREADSANNNTETLESVAA